MPYTLLVHAYSSLRLRASLVQRSHEPGAQVSLFSTLTEYDVPVEHGATVWAEITRPDGAVVTLTLTEGEAGLFQGAFVAALTGLYTVRLRATGVTMRGRPFQREQTFTASSVPGADTPPAGAHGDGGGNCMCSLLRCLLATRGIQKLLAEKGLEPKQLQKCLEGCCRRPIEATPPPTRKRRTNATPLERSPAT